MITRCYPFSHDAVTSDVEHIVRERRVARYLKRFMLRSDWLVFRSFDWRYFGDVFPRRSPTVTDGRRRSIGTRAVVFSSPLCTGINASRISVQPVYYFYSNY